MSSWLLVASLLGITVVIVVHGGFRSRRGGGDVLLGSPPAPPSSGELAPPKINNVPDYIQSYLLSYCEKCSAAQKRKIGEVLLLLVNLNQANPTSGGGRSEELSDLIKSSVQRKMRLKKFKATTRGPKMANTRVIIPTPQIGYYYGGGGDLREDEDGVAPLPTISTTPASLPSTVSAAPEPVQSVEMPTPPLPPTTTLPIYFYYLSASSSGPPTTPVVESSVGPKPTTVVP